MRGLGVTIRGRFGSGAVLATLCVSLATITINISLLNVGLPTLARDLRATNTGLEWIVDGYALVFAGFLLAAGSLGDRIGRKLVLATGLGIFAAGSVMAAASHATGTLVAARCVTGLGAAFVMPMTLSILTDVYPSEEGLRRAIGSWAATASAGAVLAPMIAGLLLSRYWWGSVFLVNAPVAAGTLVAVILTVPNRAPRRDVAIDWPGVALSITFSSLLVFSLIEGADRGWGDRLVTGGLSGAGLMLVLFVAWELRARQPLIDIRAFRVPRFAIGCGVVAVQYFFSFGTSFVVTQYVQLVLGLSALTAGFVMMPSAAVVMFASPAGARAFGRLGARPVICAGLLVAAGGAFAMGLAGTGSSVAVILGSVMMVSLGIGIMAPGTTSMVMSALPPEQAGMASGAQSATRQLGGALGVAVLGTLLAARYSTTLARTSAATAAAPYVAGARRSLAAALGPAAPGAAHLVMVRLARAAFVDGLHLVGLAAGGAAVACAAVVFVVLRPRTAVLPTVELAPAPAGPAGS